MIWVGYHKKKKISIVFFSPQSFKPKNWLSQLREIQWQLHITIKGENNNL